MMTLALPDVPSTPRRVKVYELKDSDWFDRGTGYCTGVIDHPYIQVKAEEQHDRTLLETKINKDDGYQKQQETLIVWTEPSGVDMALSFQEPEGCAAIWEFVSHVQNHMLATADEILSDDAGESSVISAMVQLPDPELGNLEEIEMIIRQASQTVQSRDALARYILSENWLSKLIPRLEEAEDLESLVHLHRLCNIMKMVILLNDTVIVESIVSDELIFGVVGMLEYDPDFPSHKANHRQFLADKSKFKEVVPIRDADVQKKIHHTYRLQYLKDVVLARILDDPTFSVLNSLIFFNQFDILQHLQNSQGFMKELFGIFKDDTADVEKRKLGIHFIQNCCSVAKSIQAPARNVLYQNFIQNGLFQVIDNALGDSDQSVRIAATDVLVAMIDHDAAMMRTNIYRQINENQKPLTHTLIELLLGEQDLGVKAQIADAMRVLLDHTQPSTVDMIKAGGGGEIAARMHARAMPLDADTEGFLKVFYEETAMKLFQPLKDLEGRESLTGLSIAEVSLYAHLVETLCFFVRQHSYRSKYFLLNESLPARVAQLLQAREKHLKLIALKFFRTCIGLQDEFYTRHMIKNNLFEPILNVVVETMPRDNLLNSACLEFFEFIRREVIKPVIRHLADSFRETMQKITYVRTFAELLARADAAPPSPPRFANGTTQLPRRLNPREMDAAEEAYFDADDDEPPAEPQDAPSADDADSPQQVKILNGSPPNKPLVDYDSDEENAPVAEPPRKRLKSEEDDDDDVLGGLARAGGQRKRSFSGASERPGPQKRMAIQVKVKADVGPAEEKREESPKAQTEPQAEAPAEETEKANAEKES